MRSSIKFYPVIVLSFLFLINVSGQDKKDFPRPKNRGVYVIAHRGAHEGIPENSLPAFQKAIDLGCDFVEIDTRRTKDGVIVSVHNSTVDKYVKGYKGKVKDFTLAELKKMDIGSKVGKKWKGTRIPTVEEIFKLCSGKIGVYIDLKEAVVPEVTELLKKYDMASHAVWYIPASHMKEIMQVKELCPESYVMPDPGNEKNIARVTAKAHPLVLATDMGELSKNYVRMAHENGAMVFVDEKEGTPEEWDRIIDWGTDGIQTDRPYELIEYLNKKQK